MEEENKKIYVVDQLEEALLQKYERLKQIIEQSEFGSEEHKAAERELNCLIDQMQTFHNTNCEYFAKDEDRKIKKEYNDDMAELEDQRIQQQKLTWKRVAFEIGKVVVPIIGSAVVYFKAQRNILKFEETGRITSTAGRELHLPKLFNK